MAVRRNRIVRPYRGKLYDMVVKNFAYVPVLNAKGKKVRDKGKIVKVRRKEVTDSFEIYYNLCLVDEYFKMLYEKCLEAGTPPYPMSNLKEDFSKSWRYLIKKYALRAPRGTRELAVKVEARLGVIDKTINEGLAGAMMGTDINKIMAMLKGAAGSSDFKRTIEFYAGFINQAFQMLGFNVISELKSNPKFNIKYFQFSIGDDLSEMISKSSSMVASEIEKAQKLKKIRDAKLKSSLLKEGYLVDTQPVFITKGRNKGVAYLTVAYDPKATQIPKPRSKPKTPKFSAKDKELIVSLDSLVSTENVYSSGDDPKAFFDLPKCSIQRDEQTDEPSLVYEPGEQEKNDLIIRQIKEAQARAKEFSVPRFKDGFGKLPNGEPEAGFDSRGRPRYKYVVPKSRLKFYNRAVRVFNKLLELRAICENKSAHSLEVFNYKKAIKPLIKGVYSSDFTDELGNTYKRFNDMEALAKKVIKKRSDNKKKRLTQPKIKEEIITVENYPDWDGKKIVYTERKVKIACFQYPSGSTFNPIHHKDLLQEALNRINLGRNPDLDPSLKDQVLEPSFREIKGAEGLSKTFQLVTLKDSEGKEKEIIVAGRYAGYELDTILNMEGRFIEGGYVKKEGGRSVKVDTDRIAFDGRGNPRTVDKVKDGDSWTYKQRLIEPYITVNPKTGVLTLGIPGENSSKADRNIMKDLANKISSINSLRDPKLPAGHKGRNPFFTFSPEDFETIRESLGSVALSASASKFMDEYYAKLRAKENATTVENTERFSPEALGGFVAETARGKFKFNNKQKEAAAWLDASGMQGVVALDTGVGKTLTSLVSIKKAINEGMELGGDEAKRRFLFVSPKSLVGNLKKEVLNFMVTGGEDFVRADGVVEKTPNWQKIVLDRIDEMSYEDFVVDFKNSEGIEDLIAEMETGDKVISDTKRLARENKHHGKEATITYEVKYKNGREVSRKEVDFQIGNLIDPTIVRTASQEDEVRTIQELVFYPPLSASEKEAKKKELAKSRRSYKKLEKKAKEKSYPALNKKYQDRYYACFFDEINEIFSKGGRNKNYAVSSLGHPRKVFLTASALDRDPVDLYRLSTLAKGKVPTRKSEKAFAEKYGVVLAGRMVALKPDKKLKEQFYNWTKENAYFAPKMDISVDSEFGVDYQDVSLPQLKELKSRTITTRMPREVQRKYKAEAKAISGELKAMVAKYRDLRGKLNEMTDKSGQFFDRRKSKPYQDLTKATSKVKTALNKLIRLSSEGSFKADVGSKVFKDNSTEKCLYFCSNKKLAESLIKKNSKIRKDKVHAVLWAKEIIFYQNGDIVAKVEEKDNMSVDAFDEKYLDTGIYTKMASEEEEDTEVESTWAMDISKKYVKENDTLATAVCSDNYARGFNFQTFTKVIHLDRGKGFDSELLKQRTARAYRGGQAKQVEEIYIDATFAPDSESEGTVSDTSRGYKIDLKNALSLQRNELEEGKEYNVFAWFEDPSDSLGSEWILTDNFTFNAEDETLEVKLNELFLTSGYVKPLDMESYGEEPTKRLVLKDGTDIKSRARVKSDFDMLSIDQIKSLVNEADQDFFQDIIVNGLKSDLTARLDARVSDTGIAIKTPAMLRSVLDPTEENLVRAEKELEDFDANPLSHLTFDPSRYDQADMWLNDQVNSRTTSEKTKTLLDLAGGPEVLDYILGDSSVDVGTDYVRMGENRFIEGASVSIYSNSINNNFVKLKPCAPRGFSTKFLFSEIVTAKRLGKKYIECQAAGRAGDTTFSGYAVWPKFGFDTQINLSRLLNRVQSDSPNQVYVQAVRQILGEDPGMVNLQKLLVITADVVTMKIKKSEAKAYKDAMEAWDEAKKNALGDRPVLATNERWAVGDRFVADSDYVRQNYSQIYNAQGEVTSVGNDSISIRLDVGYTQTLPKDTTWITPLNPRPAVDVSASQDEIDAYDRRFIEYDENNPKPNKPKGKRSVENAVAIGEKLWGLYGSSSSMRLDLTDGSISMKIANAYIKKKALEKNLDLNDFLNAPSDLFNIEDPWCWEQEINQVKVKGQKVSWKEVISQYPEAFRTAWYAHRGLRDKITLMTSESELKSLMKKYSLIDPQTNQYTPAPSARSLQSRSVGQSRNESESSVENVQQRIKLGSELNADELSDRKLWEDSQDPCLLAVWDQLRLENYAGQVVAELIEGGEDPDLIEVQRARKDK